MPVGEISPPKKIAEKDFAALVRFGGFPEPYLKRNLRFYNRWKWKDLGFGEYGLYFLRTKDKREVDFLVTRNNKPWFMVEVKSSKNSPLSRNLEYFQTTTGAEHAFQVMMDADFENADCFEFSYPVRVSGRSFLSQLI